MSGKSKRSFRLTPTADALLEALADKKGLSKTAVLETLIRDEAKRESITPEPGAILKRVAGRESE